MQVYYHTYVSETLSCNPEFPFIVWAAGDNQPPVAIRAFSTEYDAKKYVGEKIEDRYNNNRREKFEEMRIERMSKTS